MEALTKLLAIALPLLMLTLLGAGMLLIYLAGKTMIEAKRIDMVSVAIIIVILLLIPVGIREYPPMLADAFIDSFRTIWSRSGDIEAITQEIINDSQSKWNNADDAPVIIATPQFTPTPYPTTINHFELTATAYFDDFPTAIPQSTPEPTATNRPMIQPTRTLQPTATICVASQPGDLQRGCLPPTPIPGN